ncbi:MAG: hypothetical protein JST79_18350 [Acidobacteria bacterium]|jgi:hypothetical protein|nr:hypothetical protein [Acidobacteriota bacterium]
MKALLLMTMLAFCLQSGISQAAFGQNGDSGKSQKSTHELSPESRKTRMNGCLEKQDGGFILTDSMGIKFKLSGNASLLSKNAGHQVEVLGEVARPNAESSDSPLSTDSSTGTQGTGSATKQGVVQTFRVAKVMKTADACSSK